MGNKRSFIAHVFICAIATLMTLVLIFNLDFNNTNNKEKQENKESNNTVITNEKENNNIEQTVEEIVPIKEEHVELNEYTNCGEYTISSYTHIDKLTNDDHVFQRYASSKNFEIGTKIYIDGVGKFIITDNNTEENSILIFLNNEQACINFGIKKANVYVMKDWKINTHNHKKNGENEHEKEH